MPPHIADDAQPRLAPGVRLQIDSTTGKGVLLFPEGILELNETAQEILTRCDGQTLSEIVRVLAEDYEVDPATLAADVRETLADLQRRKLVHFV
ncbi:MAG: pyrroloquinoline quinone biosynthesis peptide chaperone PqqD [Verrucomicrobiota bacterium]